MAALDAIHVELPLAALAKREELIWLPGSSEALRLDRSDPAHLVLRQARDEAHRFAVSRHRRRRKKKTLASELLGVPGIGPGRTRALLKRFGSVKGVQEAAVDELQNALGPRLGQHLWNHLHAGSSSTHNDR
jgi:excinuclease ABC subunit C